MVEEISFRQLAPAPSAVPLPPHEFHRFIVAVVKRVQALELARYEEPDQPLDELLSRVRAILQVSIEILGLVLEWYEREDLAVPPSRDAAGQNRLLAEVDRRMESMRSASDVADLAFVARLGLRGRVESLNPLTSETDRWDVIGACGSACREALKSLSALELAICAQEGLSSENSYYGTEISRALRTRLTYASFRGELAGSEPEEPPEITRRLRLAAISIAKLIGRDAYPDLRVSDRIQIRGFQTKILSWLRQGEDSASHARAGRRLWQDLVGFGELLQQVNNRAELRNHDRERVDAALDAVARCRTSELGHVDLRSHQEMQSLRGRDAELDELLDVDPDGLPLDPWEAVLRRLQDALKDVGSPATERSDSYDDTVDFEWPDGDLM